MKAYQYFHLPSGYHAKYSDSTAAELANCEAVRQGINGDTYYAYYVTAAAEGVVLHSVKDPQGNQFVVGRYGKQSEFTGFPITYGEMIRDVRLVRPDAPLNAMGVMVPPAALMAVPGIDMTLLAQAYEAVLAGKNAIISQAGIKGCTDFLKLLCGLLPKPLVNRLGFIIGDVSPLFKVKTIDPYGNTTELTSQILFLPRAVSDVEWAQDCIILDGVGGRKKAPELGAVGSLIAACSSSDKAALDQFKLNYVPLIREDGSLDQSSFAAINAKNQFIQGDFAGFSTLVSVFPTIPDFLKTRLSAECADRVRTMLDNDELQGDQLSKVLAFRDIDSSFAGAIDVAYRAFLGRNLSLLDSAARRDYAENLARDNDAFDNFLNEAYIEQDSHNRSMRFEILHHALVTSRGMGIDGEIFTVRAANLINFTNIANVYAALPYDERINGELIFNCIPAHLNSLTEDQIDAYAILLYSAYLRDCEREWKRMRLRGLETRLKGVPVLTMLGLLVEIKRKIEFYSDNLLEDPTMHTTGLENFYFDEHGDTIRDLLTGEPTADIVRFYDEHRLDSYSGMLSALINAISSFDHFLDSFSPQSRTDIEESLRLYSSIQPSNVELDKITSYLRAHLAEYDLEAQIKDFRFDFINRCYELLGKPNPNIARVNSESERAFIAFEAMDSAARVAFDTTFVGAVSARTAAPRPAVNVNPQSQNPYQQPVQNPYQQPVQNPYQQPVQNPYQQPGTNPFQQPAPSPSQQPNPYQQPRPNPYPQNVPPMPGQGPAAGVKKVFRYKVRGGFSPQKEMVIQIDLESDVPMDTPKLLILASDSTIQPVTDDQCRAMVGPQKLQGSLFHKKPPFRVTVKVTVPRAPGNKILRLVIADPNLAQTYEMREMF